MKPTHILTFLLLALSAVSLADAQSIKWHPGHYVMLNEFDNRTLQFRHVDEIAREPIIEGIHLRLRWYQLEPRKGVYDFSTIDAFLNKLKSLPAPKRLVLYVQERNFNSSVRTGLVPGYLLSDSIYNGGVIKTRTGYAPRLWEAPVMDRVIALYRAIGARYDQDEYFEGIMTPETTLSLTTNPAGYSVDKLKGQYKRLVTSARAVMPRTSLFLNTNWLGGQNTMADLIQSLVAPQVAASGPDVMPNNITTGQLVWTGRTGADYRGFLAIGAMVGAGELGGPLGNYTPKQINDFAYGTLHVNHLFWVRNEWVGTPAQRWKTGILPFLRTNPPIRSGCPDNYGLCDQ